VPYVKIFPISLQKTYIRSIIIALILQYYPDSMAKNSLQTYLHKFPSTVFYIFVAKCPGF